MKKSSVVIVFLFFLCIIVEHANAAGIAFAKKELTKDSLADALEAEELAAREKRADEKKSLLAVRDALLNATCGQYVQGMEILHPKAGVESCEGMRAYVSDLTEERIPVDAKISSCRLMVPGRSVDCNYVRPVRPGERGLYDRSMQKFVISATCGNVIKVLVKKVRKTKQGEYARPRMKLSTYRPMRMSRPMFAPSQVDFGVAYRDCPDGSDCWSANVLAGHVVEAAGFVGGMGILDIPDTNISNDSYSTSNATASGGRATANGGNVVFQKGQQPVHPHPPTPPGGPIHPNPPDPPRHIGGPVHPYPPYEYGGGGGYFSPQP
ncbi:MAG: hypothetical protein HYT37_03110 [Candidatus Sungbacteria bacterium]|nr:hypothetical protein [Candidatus Sungbacteria bacterium]